MSNLKNNKSTNNLTLDTSTCQVKYKLKSTIKNYVHEFKICLKPLSRRDKLTLSVPLSVYIQENPEEFFEAHEDSVKSLKVLNALTYFYAKYGLDCHPSQTKIANIVGCTRDYVVDVIFFWASLGVISKFSRESDYDTLHYTVNDFFKLSSVKSWLYKYLPNVLKLGLSLTLLASSQKGLPVDHSTSISSTISLYKVRKCLMYNESVYCRKELHISTMSYSLLSSPGRKMNRIDYENKKEEEHIKKCIEARERNDEQYQELLKREQLSFVVQPVSASVCVTKIPSRPRPTEADITPEQWEKILGYPPDKQEKVKNSVMIGKLLLWEHENNGNVEEV